MKVNKSILIALVVTVLVCGYIFLFTGKKQPSPAVPIMAPIQAAQIQGQVRQKTGVAESVRPRLEVNWDRDPFEMPKALEANRLETPGAAMKLTAILSGQEGRVAVIGSEVVRKGDLIYGERVQEIGRTGVVLGRGDSRRYLTLEGGSKEGIPGTSGAEVGK